VQIACELERRGLAVRRDVEELCFADLRAAAGRSVRRVSGEEITTGIAA
jgi:hypothetical protein